jgi:hypothetical protein
VSNHIADLYFFYGVQVRPDTMAGDLVVWTYAPVRLQHWERADGQKALVEIDEYGICEVTLVMLTDLLSAAGWHITSDNKLRPVA